MYDKLYELVLVWIYGPVADFFEIGYGLNVTITLKAVIKIAWTAITTALSSIANSMVLNQVGVPKGWESFVKEMTPIALGSALGIAYPKYLAKMLYKFAGALGGFSMWAVKNLFLSIRAVADFLCSLLKDAVNGVLTMAKAVVYGKKIADVIQKDALQKLEVVAESTRSPRKTVRSSPKRKRAAASPKRAAASKKSKTDASPKRKSSSSPKRKRKSSSPPNRKRSPSKQKSI
jgi:hypothetical protein